MDNGWPLWSRSIKISPDSVVDKRTLKATIHFKFYKILHEITPTQIFFTWGIRFRQETKWVSEKSLIFFFINTLV